MGIIQKIGLRTGIVSGLWSILGFMALSWLNSHLLHNYIPDVHIRTVSGILNLVILLVGIYVGMKADNRIMVGVGISIITAIVLSIFTILYCKLINPGYADFMVEQIRQSLVVAGKSASEINARLPSIRKEYSTVSQTLMAFVSQLIIGSVASCLFYYLLKSKNKSK